MLLVRGLKYIDWLWLVHAESTMVQPVRQTWLLQQTEHHQGALYQTISTWPCWAAMRVFLHHWRHNPLQSQAASAQPRVEWCSGVRPPPSMTWGVCGPCINASSVSRSLSLDETIIRWSSDLQLQVQEIPTSPVSRARNLKRHLHLEFRQTNLLTITSAEICRTSTWAAKDHFTSLAVLPS